MSLKCCPDIPVVLALCCVLLSGCSQDPAAVRDRIYALQADPTEENLNQVREELNNPDGDVRATALHVLVNHPVPDGGEIALRFLEDEHPFVRSRAAILLGELEYAEATGALGRRLAEDEDWHVRHRAAEALSGIGGDEAAGLLRAGFSDPVKEVRRASIMGVSRIAPADALDGLVLLLRDDKDWEVRVQAARALASLKLPEAIPALEKAMYEDENEFVQAAAAHAVKVLGEE